MQNDKPHLAGDRWLSSTGKPIVSLNPSTGDQLWTGPAADPEVVVEALSEARRTFDAWAQMEPAGRIEYLEAFAELLKEDGTELAEAISEEVGKPRWEAATEVRAMAAKVAISIQAHRARNSEFGSAGAMTRFRPHGVVGVLGPFNFPGHLPNGHIVPALLAGNTVVFKPSPLAPWIAEVTVKLWIRAGLPPGVLNLTQGGHETAKLLASNEQLDGLFFTGSSRAGIALNRLFADRPGKILALEMGGNNPLIIHKPGDLDGAAYLAAQSAYATAGQRCTCARRLIVTDFPGRGEFLEKLQAVATSLRVGPPTDDPEPYMGPVISEEAASRLLTFQSNLVANGGRTILEARHLKERTGLVSPAIIDTTDAREIPDEEVFGPLLQVKRVADLDEAIEEANRTRYGLAAGLISDDPGAYEQFSLRARAGIVNWNKPLTGASSAAPFGGIGLSGNHRPSAYLAADYCVYPVASMEAGSAALPEEPLPGLPLP